VAAQRPEPGTFLALLSDVDLDALLKLGSTRRFVRGEKVMHQGEPGDRVLVLLAGHVKASSNDSHGREMVLSFRGPGDVLGELTFSHAEPRSSNVTAIEPVEAQSLAASEFRRYLEQRPAAALALIDVISRRFRDANRKRVQFGDLDTVGRIAARLVELCERYGRHRCRDGDRLPVTQDDLGSWTASSRAGVASALRTMRELGWITTERRRITVRDLNALMQRVARAKSHDARSQRSA
jgi:CRP-like cAMP-binding protein